VNSRAIGSVHGNPPTTVPNTIFTPARSASFQLPPYTLSPGNTITEPDELPAACSAYWTRAVNHFTKGYITSWLREGVNRLRAAHQHGQADDLEVIASGAELDKAKAELDGARAQAVAAEQRLAQGDAALREARHQFSLTTITAPRAWRLRHCCTHRSKT
jgi:hypothetical protein